LGHGSITEEKVIICRACLFILASIHDNLCVEKLAKESRHVCSIF
jgi:hypothetical protein